MTDAISPALLSQEELARMRSWEKDGAYLGCGNAVAALLSHIVALEAKVREWEIRYRGADTLLGEAIDARELERERCAKIAELRRNMFGGEFTTDNEKLIVDHIAAAIRKGGET